MNNLLRSKPIIGAVKYGVNWGNLQKMSFCSAESKPARFEKTINSVTLLGRVGATPQNRGNEKFPVTTFSVATHVNFKVENGDWAQRTDWHQVAVFKESLREQALNFVTKGKRVMVTGRLAYNDYTDKEGVSRTGINIIADEITFFN